MIEERKIIQILISDPILPGQTAALIYALCSDGSLWWKNVSEVSKWQREDDIPQD